MRNTLWFLRFHGQRREAQHPLTGIDVATPLRRGVRSPLACPGRTATSETKQGRTPARAGTDRPAKAGIGAFVVAQLAMAWLWLTLSRLWDPDNTDGWDEAAKVRVHSKVSIGGRPVPSLSSDELHEIRLAARRADVAFFVPGVPAPQGNKRPFRNKHSGKIAMVETSKRTHDWRVDIRDAFDKTRAELQQPLDGPLSVRLRFVFPRPQSHMSARGGLKPSAPPHFTSAPDVDKLCRGVLDAMQLATGGSAITDDRYVVDLAATKEYGERPGCWVQVRRLA